MTTSETLAPMLGEPLPVELMNTIWADRSAVHDALADGPDVRAWLLAAPAIPGVPADELSAWLATDDTAVERTGRRLRALRDALRCLAAAQTADERERGAPAVADPAAALEVINRAAASAPHWSRLEWTVDAARASVTRSGADPGAAVVAGLAEAGIALFASEQRDRLRACNAPGCLLYFVKQHPRREWCSDGCGNRARAARHYRRHRAT